MGNYAYALGLFSVRKSLEQNMPGTLMQVKSIGYEGVEFFGELRWKPEEVKEALDAAGLSLVGWHTRWADLQPDRFEDTVAYFQTIGNQHVIVPSLPGGMLATRESCIETAGKFNELAVKLAVFGMRIGYHNHASEMPFFTESTDCPFTVFFDNTDPSVIVQMDNGNALSGNGPGLLSLLRRYAGRYTTIHLKPFSQGKGAVDKMEGFETMIGEDDIPWMDFMYLCRTAGGVQWYVVEYESEKMYSEFEGVSLNLEALVKMEAEGRL